MTNPKIGEILPNGGIRYPTQTVLGAAFARGEFDPAPAIVHNLGGHYIAVGDVFYPASFDYPAAVEALVAEAAALHKAASKAVPDKDKA